MMIWAQQSQIHFRAAEFTIDDDGKNRRIQETDRGHVSRVVYHYHIILLSLYWEIYGLY
jgi:hypothetical protein